MSIFSALRFLMLGMFLFMLAVSCSHGSNDSIIPVSQIPDKLPSAGTISLGTTTYDGNDVLVPVEISSATDIYAMSFRIGYDVMRLKPVAVEWGSVFNDEDSYFQLLDRDGYIPLAFIRLSGLPGISGSTSLCRLRFTALGDDISEPWLINDLEYISARNSSGNKVGITIGGDAQ